MRIAVDAMGGDHAPAVVVEGAVLAARAYNVEIVFVGQEDLIRSELAKHDAGRLPISIVHASQVIGPNEGTIAVKQKRDNSMLVAARLVRDGKADAFASAGNSGAAMAAALFGMGRIRGIDRPALAPVYPASANRCILLDIGANTDPKPMHLLQFAIMGAAYAERCFGTENPRIAIVSNGEEAEKGSELVRAAFPLLQNSGLNFVGNVEGKDIPRGVADVVVTDGFTGNVIIKLTEGVIAFVGRLIKQEFTAGIRNKVALLFSLPALLLSLPALLLFRPTLVGLLKRMDYREVGGAPLLGVHGVVVIGHGRSDARAIRGMIRAAQVGVEQDWVEAIQGGLAAWQATRSVEDALPPVVEIVS